MGFDLHARVEELSRRETCWLRALRARIVAEQRRLRLEELAIVTVLDDRGALDAGDAARFGVSPKTERDTVETARRLEALPAIAKVAAEGLLSEEQLVEVAKFADETTDAEWAERAQHTSPVDLRRMARTRETPSVEESWRRREARCVWMRWNEAHSILRFGGELPDLMGAEFEATLNELIDKLRPAKGCSWDTRAHRGADALVHLCRLARTNEHAEASDAGRHAPKLAPRPNLQVQVPQHGPASIAGIPIADELLEQLRANATIELHLTDHHGQVIAIGRKHTAISPKKATAIITRDGHCRMPGCDARIGLDIHHLIPRSWGGTDHPSNLASVCTVHHHHERLIPHGPYALVGNPNQPDGLRLVIYADLSADQAAQHGLPPPPGRRRRE